jgi:hypothetical protein
MSTVTETMLPRLLSGLGEWPMTDLGSHVDVHGSLPDLRRRAPGHISIWWSRPACAAHGGASFPVATKLRAVASRRRPRIVVANGTEGEPASKKDRALLRELPHLVIDGAAVAARAVGASQAIVAFSESDDRSSRSLARAVGERGDAGRHGEPRVALVAVPERYLSGQESALVDFLSGGPGKPSFGARPFERGVRHRPTLVQKSKRSPTLRWSSVTARAGFVGSVPHRPPFRRS